MEINREENRILLKLKSWEDKQEILCKYHNTPLTYLIKNHEKDVNPCKNIEKVQGKFCKFSLGLSKYYSNSAVFRELGQYPIYIQD